VELVMAALRQERCEAGAETRLCSGGVTHVSQRGIVGGAGWSCGYRNIQMVISHHYHHPHQHNSTSSLRHHHQHNQHNIHHHHWSNAFPSVLSVITALHCADATRRVLLASLRWRARGSRHPRHAGVARARLGRGIRLSGQSSLTLSRFTHTHSLRLLTLFTNSLISHTTHILIDFC
jgi:hypothetical protein